MPFHKLPDVLPDTPFSVLNARPAGSGRSARCGGRSRAGWSSPESIGTAPALRASATARPACTRAPPAAADPLKPFLPEHLLVGHGPPIHGGDAAAALLDALNRSRRDIPTFVLQGCRA